MKVKFKLPFKTPSINHLYGHRGYRKYLTKDAKELREKIVDICYKEIDDKMYLMDGKKLKVTVEIYEDWYTKEGLVKKKDISNREKFLIDSVFKAVEWDDKFIFEHTMKKIQSSKEFAVVTIEILK